MLTIAGERQSLVVREEGGCFVVEFLEECRPICVPVPTLEDAEEDMQEEENVNGVADIPAVAVTSEYTEEMPSQHNILFEKLVALRKTLATANKVPPYLVFHDKTLREMADKMPSDMQAMSHISGVGQSKLEKYGNAFLNVINGGAA